MRANTVATFYLKYISELNSGCWLWIGALSSLGYGTFTYKQKNMLAHRFSYELYKGKIPDGKEIDHLCCVRSCVNPWHLEAVTHIENVRRGKAGETIGKINRSKTHCPKGHPYSGDNLVINSSNGGRLCRECARLYDRLRRPRKRQ